MTSLKQQIFDEFEIVRRQRDAALKGLNQAQETIDILEAEVKALKYHSELAFSRVANEKGVSKAQVDSTAKVKPDAASEWIDDWWLCNLELNDVLGPAEEAWKQNQHNPQAAILLATDKLKDNLVKRDRIRCKLFMAAIQLSVGTLEPACAIVNECIHDCATDPRYRELAAIACYIRGRIFAEMTILPNAHWDFSMAVFSPNYHEKAKAWRDLCETRILEHDDRDDAEDNVE